VQALTTYASSFCRLFQKPGSAPVTGNAFYVGHTGSNHCSIKSPEGGQHEAMKKAPFSFRAGVLSVSLPEGYE
jgi:hypothetical protein